MITIDWKWSKSRLCYYITPRFNIRMCLVFVLKYAIIFKYIFSSIYSLFVWQQVWNVLNYKLVFLTSNPFWSWIYPSKVLRASNFCAQGSLTMQALSFAAQVFDEWLVLQRTVTIFAPNMEDIVLVLGRIELIFFILESSNHRIIEWFELEGMLKTI